MMLPEITLAGTPYEKGCTLGRAHGDRVRISIATYRRRFEAIGIPWEKAQRLARGFLPYFTGVYAKYIDEMHGIADGAGVPFDEILAINVRSELLYTGYAKQESCDECTAFSAVFPATENGAALAGQTWDYTRTQRDASVIARFPAEDGIPAMLILLEAGLIGGKGVNAAGICVTINALTTGEAGQGIPLHIRMRRMLESRDMNSAFIEGAKMPCPVSANLIVTHKDGLTLSLELAPSGVDVIQPENGVIVHTNHFIGPRHILRQESRAGGSTYMRWQRMHQLMHSKRPLVLSDLEEFCKDHKGYPMSVCVHPAPWHSEEQKKTEGCTNYAFVADLTNNVVRFAFGNPCESGFTDLPVEL